MCVCMYVCVCHSMFINQLEMEGYSIFVVEGELPTNPATTEATSQGKWWDEQELIQQSQQQQQQSSYV